MTDKDRIYRWLTQADLEQMLDEAFARGAKAMHQLVQEVRAQRALLEQARAYVVGVRPTLGERVEMRNRIDAALAEPVVDWQPHEPVERTEYVVRVERERDEARALLQDLAAACRGLKPLSDKASTVVGPVFRQREEAWAEVGRLTRELEEVRRARVGVERAAYRRGAEAMREAAARLVDEMLSHTLTDAADRIRALPICENDP